MYKGKILKNLILIIFIVYSSFAIWISNVCMSDGSNCACMHHGCKHKSSERAINNVCDCDQKAQVLKRDETNFPIRDANPLSILPLPLFIPTDIIISQVPDITEKFGILNSEFQIPRRAPPFSLV